MNPLIEYWDNVIKGTDWDKKSKEATEAIYEKCSELSSLASEDEKTEFGEHVRQSLQEEENDTSK